MASRCARAASQGKDMAGDDVILRLRISSGDTEAQVEIVSQTSRMVLVRIDPRTPWDSSALLHLSSALQIVAKTLPLRESED